MLVAVGLSREGATDHWYPSLAYIQWLPKYWMGLLEQEQPPLDPRSCWTCATQWTLVQLTHFFASSQGRRAPHECHHKVAKEKEICSRLFTARFADCEVDMKDFESKCMNSTGEIGWLEASPYTLEWNNCRVGTPIVYHKGDRGICDEPLLKGRLRHQEPLGGHLGS